MYFTCIVVGVSIYFIGTLGCFFEERAEESFKNKTAIAKEMVEIVPRSSDIGTPAFVRRSVIMKNGSLKQDTWEAFIDGDGKADLRMVRAYEEAK